MIDKQGEKIRVSLQAEPWIIDFKADSKLHAKFQEYGSSMNKLADKLFIIWLQAGV